MAEDSRIYSLSFILHQVFKMTILDKRKTDTCERKGSSAGVSTILIESANFRTYLSSPNSEISMAN